MRKLFFKKSFLFIIFVCSSLNANHDSTNTYWAVANKPCGYQDDHRGKRHTPEDGYAVITGEDFDFFLVCDGHCGPRAAYFVVRNLLQNIKNDPKFPGDIMSAIWDGCKKTQKDLLDHPSSINDGTTAAFAIIDKRGENPKLWAGNIGDSEVVLDHGPEPIEEGPWRPVKKHTLDDMEEFKRAINAGALITSNVSRKAKGPNMRRRIMRRVNIPRTFGERPFLVGQTEAHEKMIRKLLNSDRKIYLHHGPFETTQELRDHIEYKAWFFKSNPQNVEELVRRITKNMITWLPSISGPVELTEQFQHLCLYSDGVGDKLDMEDVMSIVNEYKDPKDAAKKLVEVALELWLGGTRSDDITGMVLNLRKLRTGKHDTKSEIFGGVQLPESEDFEGYHSATDFSSAEESEQEKIKDIRFHGRRIEERETSALKMFLKRIEKDPKVWIPLIFAAAAWYADQ